MNFLLPQAQGTMRIYAKFIGDGEINFFLIVYCNSNAILCSMLSTLHASVSVYIKQVTALSRQAVTCHGALETSLSPIHTLCLRSAKTLPLNDK